MPISLHALIYLWNCFKLLLPTFNPGKNGYSISIIIIGIIIIIIIIKRETKKAHGIESTLNVMGWFNVIWVDSTSYGLIQRHMDCFNVIWADLTSYGLIQRHDVESTCSSWTLVYVQESRNTAVVYKHIKANSTWPEPSLLTSAIFGSVEYLMWKVKIYQ